MRAHQLIECVAFVHLAIPPCAQDFSSVQSYFATQPAVKSILTAVGPTPSVKTVFTHLAGGSPMSLIAFEDAVWAHFANPPATWHIQPDPEGWNIVDAHGAVLDTCATAAQAEQCRHSGPPAQRWYRRTDWYLGYDTRGRALTSPERLIVADVVDIVTAADFAIRGAASIRTARFVDQDAGDDRLWLAALLSNGRYQIRGHYFGTYAADQLDFHDEQATAELCAFLREFITGTPSVDFAETELRRRGGLVA